MSMKTAITIWNGRISPVFDVSGQVLVIESECGKIISEKNVSFQRESLEDRLLVLKQDGVKRIVCGAVSCQAQSLAENFGFEVTGFIAGDCREVIRAMLEDRISDIRFAMPGCGRRKRCCRRRQLGN